jgi:hypothetical protein
MRMFFDWLNNQPNWQASGMREQLNEIRNSLLDEQWDLEGLEGYHVCTMGRAWIQNWAAGSSPTGVEAIQICLKFKLYIQAITLQYVRNLSRKHPQFLFLL